MAKKVVSLIAPVATLVVMPKAARKYMTCIAHLLYSATVNQVMTIGKGSSLGTTHNLRTPGHKSQTTYQVDIDKLECWEELRHGLILRIMVLLHSAEPRVPTRYIPKELKQPVIPKREREKGW